MNPASQEVFGYVGFIFLLVVPGLFVGLLTGLLKGKRFFDVLAFSFGTSLAVVPIVLALINILWREITAFAVLGVILVSAIGTSLLLWRRAIKPGQLGINRIEFAAVCLVPVQGIILSLQYAKYPIFPMIFSSDFGYHLQTSLQLQAGDVAVTGLGYPPAVHLLLAAALTLQAGVPISVVQHAVAIIGSFAPLLTFAVASRILGSQKTGLVASLIYVFTGVSWYTAIFASGLFANFLANLMILAVLLLVAESVQNLTHSRRILLFVLATALFISHYTVAIFIAAMWLSLLVVWKRARPQLSNYIQILGLITLPGGILAALRPGVVAYMMTLPTFTGRAAGVSLTVKDPLSNILAQLSPFLQALYQEIGPVLFALTFVSIPIALYWAVRRERVWTLLLLEWFLLVWIVTPYSEIAWRFSKSAVLPLTLIWPLALVAGLESLFPRLIRKKLVKRKGERPRLEVNPMYVAKGAILVAVCVGLLYNSAIYIMLQDLSVSRGDTSRNQNEVYDSMHWLAVNRDDNEKVIGVGDWRFLYFRSIWGRDVLVNYNLTGQEAYELAQSESYKYVVVSNFLVMPPWGDIVGRYLQEPTFQNSPGLKLEYSNASVSIYSVKP